MRKHRRSRPYLSVGEARAGRGRASGGTLSRRKHAIWQHGEHGDGRSSELLARATRRGPDDGNVVGSGGGRKFTAARRRCGGHRPEPCHAGRFEITLLPAGTYALNVQREGFQPFTQQGLTIRLDRTIKVKLALVPDTLQEKVVEIVAQRPTIAVNTTQQGGSISKEQMNLVPYGRNGRTFDQVTTAIPGVQPDANGGIAMNGSGSPEQNYIIDGVNVSDPAYGTLGTTLIQDFVQEVDVKTGGYQAEYGRATGGIVNVVTKSGGNEFHGSVFVNWSPFEAPRKQIGALGQALSTTSTSAPSWAVPS
ncbi:MAG: hypothetical protein E6J85_12995 [Deltaproteobacteria bacterium]|nr:MAG: hypothetical protein E6J85_12995 [Deltaproteobacteria bacterium]